jgi:hypothetical protein
MRKTCVVFVLLTQPHCTRGASLDVLKASFRLTAARAERGFAASPTTRTRLQALAAELEADASVTDTSFAPTASDSILGKWTLDFCDAADVLSLALLPLPAGGRLGPIYQQIERGATPDALVAQNGVVFVPPSFVPAAVSDADSS